MIALQLHGDDPCHGYRIAGKSVVCDERLPELEAFADGGSRRGPACRPPDSFEPAEWTTVTEGLRDARDRRVELLRGRPGYELRVAGAGVFRISPGGERVALRREARGAAREALVETVLGPALVLALALQGVDCLHASAIELEGRRIVFLGASGAGKSTLAARLAEILPECRCLADDVVPLARGDGKLCLDPRFPQLKYPPDRQPGRGVPAGELALICLLHWSSSPSAADFAWEPLRGSGSALALVRHTVAARLFCGDLLRAHLERCARRAAEVPVHRLRMPKRWDVVPRIAEGVRAWARESAESVPFRSTPCTVSKQAFGNAGAAGTESSIGGQP